MRNSALIRRLVLMIVDCYRPERIVLFGSGASDGGAPPGDIDLLVIGRSDRPRALRTAEIAEDLAITTLPVDILFVTPAEARVAALDQASIVATALCNGRELYARVDKTARQGNHINAHVGDT